MDSLRGGLIGRKPWREIQAAVSLSEKIGGGGYMVFGEASANGDWLLVSPFLSVSFHTA